MRNYCLMTSQPDFTSSSSGQPPPKDVFTKQSVRRIVLWLCIRSAACGAQIEPHTVVNITIERQRKDIQCTLKTDTTTQQPGRHVKSHVVLARVETSMEMEEEEGLCCLRAAPVQDKERRPHSNMGPQGGL